MCGVTPCANRHGLNARVTMAQARCKQVWSARLSAETQGSLTGAQTLDDQF